MKIAIFHNLKKGGALNFVKSISGNLKSKNNKIDIFSFENNIPKNKYNHLYLYKLKKTKNAISQMFQIFVELKNINKQIAKKIEKNKYDLVLVFPCLLTQSPFLLKYLNHTNFIYVFTEPKREFYEKTSYDFSIKKTISDTIRKTIKIIDKINCSYAKNIVSISEYSSNQLLKIYKKRAFTIYPGIKFTHPKKIYLKNNQKILSVGALQKIKGHDFSIKQIAKKRYKIKILGRKTPDYKNIIKIIKKYKAKDLVSIIHTEKENKKNTLYKKHSLFLANQQHEPFGLTTLEAVNNNCYVIGKNEGGTPEIIRHGMNGFLYPNSIKIAQKALDKKYNQKNINISKNCKIDWDKTTEHLLYLYHYLKNEPTE